MKLRSLTVLCSVLAAAPLAVRAADLNWDGDCGDPTQKWHCTCSAPNVGLCNTGGTSNWDNDGIPGAADNATIAAGSGEVDINNDTTVMSVNAGSGLKHNFYSLTLTGASSSIQGLRLFSQGRLFVDGTLDLIGPSFVQSNVHGPGTLVSNGDVDLSFAILRDLVVFRNQGNANVSAGNLLFGPGGATLVNEGGLTLFTNRDVNGEIGLFINSGNVTYTGPGTTSFFSPQYVQTAGDLDIQGGKMTLQSLFIDLQGGSLTVAAGATLTINSPFGGPEERRFSGLSEVTGLGLLDLLEDMTVAQPVVMSLGQGTPTGGSGGFRLQSTLTLEANLTNGAGHRMRFRFGTLLGMGGIFINNGQAYTNSNGSAIFRADVNNKGTFSLLGPGMSLGDGATFTNNFLFEITNGNISQGPGVQGRFRNNNTLNMEGANPMVDSNVTVFFENVGGVVQVLEGILRLQGPVGNLQAGVLTGGDWRVFSGGRLEFPGGITELVGSNVSLSGNGGMPDLVSLELLSGGSDLTVGSGTTLNLSGLTVTEGSTTGVAADSSLIATDPIELGDPDDSIIPELSGSGLLPRGPGGEAAEGPPLPPTIITPTLNNGFGRVLPIERNDVGTMQLIGDYVQGAGGRLHIEVSTAGSDLLAIDGNASLAGRLELKRLDEVPLGTPFTILTTVNGTVTGTFDEIVSQDVFSVTYLPQSVMVVLEAACRSPIVFGETILGQDENAMVWSAPADVHFAKGLLDSVSSYTTLTDDVLLDATSLDISADAPLPGEGFYYVVRYVGCGSWQTVIGAEPGRDAALP